MRFVLGCMALGAALLVGSSLEGLLTVTLAWWSGRLLAG